ncbi:hypothetical protein HQ571_04375 [Candidatus Kuenenbacteria bacterium]|nr:hypothetical protein [Candidatus Kuenenbacteria bacterium]
MNKKVTTIFLLLVSCFFVFLISYDSNVNASKNHKITGWAWSENIGWLSLNCYNDGINNKCIQSDYGVDYNNETRKMDGWSWSEYGGWVCFGESCSSVGNAPDGFTPEVRISEHGILFGWTNWTVLGMDGWSKLTGNEVSSSGKKYSCRNCARLKDENRDRCGLCFNSNQYEGSKEICEDCSSCSNGTCYACSKCYKHGVGIDYKNNSLVGWSWNGNGDDTGFGWLGFHPEQNIVKVNAPYVQTVGGDIYAQRGIGSLYQNVAPEGQYNATFMLQSNGSIVHFSSECEVAGECEGLGWVSDDIGVLTLPSQENDYRSNIGTLDIKGLLAGQYGKVESVNQGFSSSLYSILDGKVYYSNTDFKINHKKYRTGYTNHENASGTIVVRGDLYLNGYHQYLTSSVKKAKQLPSIGWIVLKNDDGTGGNIYISPDVDRLDGNFYAENTIYTGTKTIVNNKFDKTLQVNGLMIARKFRFERQVSDLETLAPSEQVIYDGRVIVNPPPGFADLAKALPSWE